METKLTWSACAHVLDDPGILFKQKQLVSKAETRKYNYTVVLQTKAKLHKVQLALVGMDRFIENFK